MSRIFLSHSSVNNAEAVALRDWLAAQGFDEIFLDLDPSRGLKAGERWEQALIAAANRCEAVVFLVNQAWIASAWCRKEMVLAHRLNKRMFGVLIEELSVDEVPKDLSGEWQLVRLASGRDGIELTAVLPITHEEKTVTFSAEGLQRLKHGLESAGLDPKYFAWPPANDPGRPPYRGFLPLEAEDAGIFFGRDAAIIGALDTMRALREAAPPRVFVILGASGAGKSSVLRAGIIPRLKRDDRHFLALPVIRPERAAISGEAGLLRALEATLKEHGLARTRSDVRAALAAGPEAVRALLQELAAKAAPPAVTEGETPKPLTFILSIDQGEELFNADGAKEARQLFELIAALVSAPAPDVITVFTIRTDAYEPLQSAQGPGAPLADLKQVTLSLPPMVQGAYQSVIEGPAARLTQSGGKLDIAPDLTAALLRDIEKGRAKDALPLLAFTLERLYLEYGGDGELTLAKYEALGGIKGAIEAAVQQAFKAADADPAIPRDENARRKLLRRGLIPWLAGIDTETGSPRRKVARLSQIPDESRPLIDLLVKVRLLATDRDAETGEATIEPAHEALLRQWGLLEGWLEEDFAALAVLEGVRRAARDWEANGNATAWLAHFDERLRATERLQHREDLVASLKPTDKAYLAACKKAELTTKNRARRTRVTLGALSVMLLGIGTLAYGGFLDYTYLQRQFNGMKNSWRETKLTPGDVIAECSDYCPEMVVLKGRRYSMGSTAESSNGDTNLTPRHGVIIGYGFMISKYEITFHEWDACVADGVCSHTPNDEGWGRDQRPVINVSWQDAQQFTEWLSLKTGVKYRLPSEAEWEFAARAGTTTRFYWGDNSDSPNEIAANCLSCGSHLNRWKGKLTAPVGSFGPNQFNLYDMLGNVQEWVEDCYFDNYKGAPNDGSPRTKGCADDGQSRVVRGGSWQKYAIDLRSARRVRYYRARRANDLGFRVARTIETISSADK